MMNDCECEAYFDMRYPEKSEIRYCPKHAAADDLLEALRIVQDKLNLAIDAEDWNLVGSALYIAEGVMAQATAQD